MSRNNAIYADDASSVLPALSALPVPLWLVCCRRCGYTNSDASLIFAAALSAMHPHRSPQCGPDAHVCLLPARRAADPFGKVAVAATGPCLVCAGSHV